MKLVSLCLLILISMSVSAADTQFMLKKINDAKARLETTENRILKERVGLSEQLRELEREVIALRDKTAVARRLADERTLSLSKLETRLSQWKEQQHYQQNLLNRYLQQNGLSFSTLDNMTAAEKMAEVERSASEMAIIPGWKNQSVVLNSGEISRVPTLTLGPVSWFIQQGKVGLAEQHNGRFTAIGYLPPDLAEHMQALQKMPTGQVAFDPTLGRALTKENASESLVEHVVKGGIWVVPILIFALLATTIAIIKVLQLWRLPSVVPVTSSAALASLVRVGESAQKNIKGMQRRLLDIARNTSTARERDDELFVQLQHDRHQLDKWINAVAVTAAVAPLLGLLGTVSGMIETFRMMTSFGSSDPEVISGGIAKALVTTELGLVVAIPALILNALLSRKAKHYYLELENFALLLSGDGPTGDSEAAVTTLPSSSGSVVTTSQPAGAT